MAFTPKSLITETQYWSVEMILLEEDLLHKHEVLTLEIWVLQKDLVTLEPACDPRAREAETGGHLKLSGQVVYLNQ